MKSWAWAAVCISLAGFGAVGACSSSDTTGDTGSGGSGGEGSGSLSGNGATTGSKSTGSGTQSGTGATTGPGATTGSMSGSTGSSTGDCTDEATSMACIECLIAENPKGNEQFNKFYIDNCACQDGGDCKMACMADQAVCTDPMAQVSQGCVDCMNALMNGAACITATQMDCAADPDCSALLDAAQGCPPP